MGRVMDNHVPRGQVQLMAVMVILLWWSYFAWIYTGTLPMSERRRLVFPPEALDPHQPYRHLLYPRARREPAASSPLAERSRVTAASDDRRRPAPAGVGAAAA